MTTDDTRRSADQLEEALAAFNEAEAAKRQQEDDRKHQEEEENRKQHLLADGGIAHALSVTELTIEQKAKLRDIILNDVNASSNDNSAVQRELDDTKRKLDEATRLYTKSVRDHSKSERRLQETNDTIVRLRQELDIAKGENTDLQFEIDRLERELNNAKNGKHILPFEDGEELKKARVILNQNRNGGGKLIEPSHHQSLKEEVKQLREQLNKKSDDDNPVCPPSMVDQQPEPKSDDDSKSRLRIPRLRNIAN